MAEGSRDQGSVSATDPEDDSPNMIVYRKVSLTLLVFYAKGKTRRATTREQGPDSPLVNVRSSRERLETSSSVSHCFLQHSATNFHRPGFGSSEFPLVSEVKVEFRT